MKNLILALSILFMGYSSTAQITDPSYRSKVIELMNIQTGQGLILEEMVNQIVPNIAEDQKEDFKKDMKIVIDKLMGKTADIYMEVFTKEEVDAFLDFYTSPTGQGIQKKMPELMKKSTKMGQEFSMELMPIIQEYMK